VFTHRAHVKNRIVGERQSVKAATGAAAPVAANGVC
jgi:hypothetical protein